MRKFETHALVPTGLKSLNLRFPIKPADCFLVGARLSSGFRENSPPAAINIFPARGDWDPPPSLEAKLLGNVRTCGASVARDSVCRCVFSKCMHLRTFRTGTTETPTPNVRTSVRCIHSTLNFSEKRVRLHTFHTGIHLVGVLVKRAKNQRHQTCRYLIARYRYFAEGVRFDFFDRELFQLSRMDFW